VAFETIQGIIKILERRLLGKRTALEYAVTCFLAKGHLLIEDVPGVGKTTLARSLAAVIHGHYRRVQFTSDLLPADLLGVTIYRQSEGKFEFTEGPIFTNVLLADEINRANPKTQSALLEAMHDQQISIEGQPRPLPTPFFVVATQNAKDNYGTFPLPESQLDRFMMKISLGYPDKEYELRVIRGDYQPAEDDAQGLTLERLLELQHQVDGIHVADDVLGFLYRLILRTRQHQAFRVGISPRGGKSLFRAAQALAMVRGRDYVVPDDIAELFYPTCSHRVVYDTSFTSGSQAAEHEQIFREILNLVPPPV
jgi:MoxR-like ATPase